MALLLKSNITQLTIVLLNARETLFELILVKLKSVVSLTETKIIKTRVSDFGLE